MQRSPPRPESGEKLCGGASWQTISEQLIKARRARGSLSLSAQDVRWQSHRKNTNKSTQSQDGWNTTPRKSGKTHGRLSPTRWRKRSSGHEILPRSESVINARPPWFGIERPANRWQKRSCGRTRGSQTTLASWRNREGKI